MIFTVPLRNNRTGEERTLDVEATYWAQAQFDAVHYAWKAWGWPSTTAAVPIEKQEERAA